MNSKQHRKLIAIARALPSYCVFAEDYHHSQEWADRLIAGWCNLKRAQVQSRWSSERFREALIDLVIELDNGWDDAFRQAAAESKMSFDCVSYHVMEEMLQAYIAANRERAFDLIPHRLHAQFCWIPGWDGVSLDQLMEEFGQRSVRYNSTWLEDATPGRWLEELLRLGNLASETLLQYVSATHPAAEAFIARCRSARFSVSADPVRPAVLTAEQVVNIIENGYSWAVPMVHCEINVRALYEFDPTQSMMLSTKEGKVHLGLHDGVLNGAGYMDTYPGAVIIPPDASGFAGEQRWRWGIDSVYGIVKRAFQTVPRSVSSDSPVKSTEAIASS